MMKWIDNIPVVPLAGVALLLAVLPFGSTPHLFEKLQMLSSGELAKPIDIFDLFMHGTPLAILIVRGIRLLARK